MNIPFVKPSLTQKEYETVLTALRDGMIGGNGEISIKTQEWLADYLRVKQVLLTTSSASS